MTMMLNGWDVDAMNEAVEAVKEQPESGCLTWRSRVRWDGGFGVNVRTRDIEQLGEVLERPFILRGDHPPQLLGGNTGPTAIELLFGALGSCMAGTFAAQATARGVAVDSLEVDVSGDIDLNGFFGLRSVPPGVSGVTVSFRVQSDADLEVLEEIADAARAHSPVHDSVTRPVEVETRIERT